MCAKPTGFMEYSRQVGPKRAVDERLGDYREVQLPPSPEVLDQQAARCMDCGIPYCHAHGCPLANLVPDFNDMVYRKQWRKALDLLHATNNFPEVTGRVCPAPCEAACTLALNQEAVTIRQLELEIVERGFREKWIVPRVPLEETGKRVAVVGSGPAGLAAAQQLARKGHRVTVFEETEQPGGLLRYGIPDFKLEKWILDRRLEQITAEGVSFETGVRVGADISIRYLRRSFAAVLLSGGARTARELPVPGRDLEGVHLALDFLSQQNKRVSGESLNGEEPILAGDKRVVVIGGGDTGSDCMGTAHRQGAASVLQLEIMPEPPPLRSDHTPWPEWPHMLRTSSSHEEGGSRQWSVLTKEFLGRGGKVRGLACARVNWMQETNGRMTPEEIPGSSFTVEADLVLLALGFTREGNADTLASFGTELGENGEPILDEYGMTTLPGVFLAGDLATGASLVVRAIAAGRRAAEGIHHFLGRARDA